MPPGDRDNPQRKSGNRESSEGVAPSDHQPQGQGDEPSRDVDFGSYVSSTVRSSAELFETPASSSSSHRRRRSPSATSSSQQPASPESSGQQPEIDDPRPVERDRPQRRWRDMAPSANDSQIEPEADGDDGGSGNGPRAMFPWAFQNDCRPNWVILGGILLAILAAIALVWFLVSRGGDDEGGAVPTPTEDSVLDAPFPPADDPSTPAFVPPTQSEADLTPTAPPQRGGDNQRDPDSTSDPANSTLDPLAGIELGPVAQQCVERCMVRLSASGTTDDLMADARTRPSFAADGWIWTVASPEGIAWFEQNTETVLVSDTADTLNLYMTRAPNEETSDNRVQAFGEILDSADSWRMVVAPSIPANVRPLTDWGYQVNKVAPAPPVSIDLVDEPISLATVEIGSLIDDVSIDNIEASIADLVAMGSNDGSGVGTRYYTSAANMEAAEYLYSRLESYGMKVWYEDFLTWEGYLMVNVIGEAPGADESAIYGVLAHFDTISEDLSNAPGADDNATGVSASLEIARILSGYELQHPVRVIFVNVEEVGIIGSEQFAENAREQGIPYEGVFNLDSIGAQRQYNYVVLNGDSSTTWMADLFVHLNDAYGLNQTINAMTNDAIVADDNRLRDNGIDSIMVGRELYGQSPYHHTPGDLIETLSLPGVERLAQLTLLSLASLAQG